ncbi:helix-turn-helix domain-containing protein [uncultured Ruthenibacterium sp.]|uniref:helix-turn-helix domain-containing protein n=1 Tax=uncultured Ruthenibacterium sp. TaxID=1905347 RepID=UPI00349ECAE4
MMSAEYTGQKIMESRKQKNWTQRQLAERLHVTDKAVSKWERGINYPDVALFEPLAKELDTTVLTLLGLENVQGEEVAGAFSKISQMERKKIQRELTRRGWLDIFCGVILWGAALYTSWILNMSQIYGLPQISTAGMSGICALVIANGIFSVQKSKLL